MERLRQRRDFIAAADGVSAPTAGFVLQRRARGDEGPARVGFTVSKKVGGAVERNYVRRRLREIVRLSATSGLKPGNDYVLVGRRVALGLPFARLAEDFAGALKRLDRSPPVAGAAKERRGDAKARPRARDGQSRS